MSKGVVSVARSLAAPRACSSRRRVSALRSQADVGQLGSRSLRGARVRRRGLPPSHLGYISAAAARPTPHSVSSSMRSGHALLIHSPQFVTAKVRQAPIHLITYRDQVPRRHASPARAPPLLVHCRTADDVAPSDRGRQLEVQPGLGLQAAGADRQHQRLRHEQASARILKLESRGAGASSARPSTWIAPASAPGVRATRSASCPCPPHLHLPKKNSAPAILWQVRRLRVPVAAPRPAVHGQVHQRGGDRPAELQLHGDALSAVPSLDTTAHSTPP